VIRREEWVVLGAGVVEQHAGSGLAHGEFEVERDLAVDETG
jgi:hypothetical protein